MNIVNLFKARIKPADRFEQIIRPHIETLYRFAYRLCNSRDDAEELVDVLDLNDDNCGLGLNLGLGGDFAASLPKQQSLISPMLLQSMF